MVQSLRLEKHKRSCFNRTVILPGLYSKQAYLSSTPRPAIEKSSDGWRHTSSTGISPPAGSLSAVLIVCDGFTLEKRYHARTVTEQEYRPIAGHGLPGAARN